MQAVLLAGGKGTRLKPYTISFPKPLVPVGDYPILEIIIRQLKIAGIENIVISTGHLAGLIEAYFGQGKKWDVKIRYVYEDRPLNTAGALGLIKGLEDHFLVMNGDILTNLNYNWLLEQHVEKKATATIAVKSRESKIDFGVIETDEDGFLKEYIEKPVYNFRVSMGVNVLSRAALEMIQPDEAIGMNDLLLRIKQRGDKVYCCNTDCYWLDIGRVDDYEKAQEQFSKNQSSFFDFSSSEINER